VSQPLPLARPGAPLARRNPVAKLAAGTAFSLPLLSTLDPLTPALGLAVALAAVPGFGVRYRDLARRSWPLLAGALTAFLTMLVFGTVHSGSTWLGLGPWRLTTGTVVAAAGLALRLLAVSLPGVLVFASTDPTDLGDALVQNARLPARFALGALAAFRLVPLLGQEWRLLGLARRARGVDAGRSPVARVRLFAARSFALLAGAIRRGTRLAVAMDARGFDSGLPRTAARVQRVGPADWLLVVLAGGLAAAALAASLAAGTFRPLGG